MMLELRFLYLVYASGFALNMASATDRPIIGVVSLELSPFLKAKFPLYDAFLAASYVKAIESSGAQVVPILIGQREEYYRNIVSSINGLVIPGGSTYFNGTNNYYTTSKIMFHLAMQANKEMHFPVLGICLGFEVLLHLSNHEEEIRKKCNGLGDINLPLKFMPKFKKSSLFRKVPRRTVRTLQSNATYNAHMWCIYPQDFNDAHLDAEWRILSTTYDLSQTEFISTIEHRKYPIAGVQFHPEKSFEWYKKKQYLHTAEAIEAGKHFFDWLVQQSKLNNNSFTLERDEMRSLIYNYSPLYSSPYNVSYTQIYVFRT